MFHIGEVPKELIVVDWNSVRKGTNGKQIRVSCPLCKKTRWISRALLTYKDHYKTTFCKKHSWIFNVRWAIDREFINNSNIIVDYADQKVDVSTRTRKNRVVFIKSTCPMCKKERWVRLHCLRFNNQPSTRCMTCSMSLRSQRSSGKNNYRWQGGITISNGYRLIHIDALKERFSSDEIELITKNIPEHRRSYPEHRIVALLTYGPPPEKNVVRHLNGDKLDNRPENLLYGTHRENFRDHIEDRQEVKRLKGLVVILLQYIFWTREI